MLGIKADGIDRLLEIDGLPTALNNYSGKNSQSIEPTRGGDKNKNQIDENKQCRREWQTAAFRRP
jgi:hypothetical protein